MMGAQLGDQVTLHFDLVLSDGSVAESSREHTPVTVTLGQGELPPGFERALLGAVMGECPAVEVVAAEAFGEHKAELLHHLPRQQFAQMSDLEPGLIVAFEQPSGQTIPGIIRHITETQVQVDFNHPLAGVDIQFKAEVLAIHPATQGDGDEDTTG